MALPNGFESSQELVKAEAHVWKHVSSYVNSYALKCAIQLGIPDIIHKHGKPMTLADLADAIPINKSKSDRLHRLMRLLVHTQFFREDGNGAYTLAPPSLLLLGDDPLSVAPLALATLDPKIADPWHHLSRWFVADDATAFITAHGVPFETGLDERWCRVLEKGVASDARLIATLIVRDCQHVFDGVRSMVDVGGGTGASAEVFVDAIPGLKCTVFDLPQVVAGLKGSKTLDFVGGDMIQAIPPADAVFLKWILHDYNDEKCLKTLENCKRAIPKKEDGGKVVIVDMVVMDNKNDYEATENQLHRDIETMVFTAGKERTEKDWAKLLHDAGFKSYNITPLLGLRSIIEAFP